jgi:hypothetical protein
VKSRADSPQFWLQVQVELTGRGTQDYEDIVWRGTFLPEGAFHIEASSHAYTLQVGWTGGVGAAAWDQDATGLLRSLQLDDHEVLVLEAVVRSGFFLRSEARAHVSFIAAYAVSDGPSAGAGHEKQEEGVETGRALRIPPNVTSVDVYMRLVPGGRCVATVSVHPTTWRITHVRQRSMGTLEMWQYSGWQLWGGAFWHPGQTVHVVAEEVVEEIIVEKGSVGEHVDTARFKRPPVPMWPPGPFLSRVFAPCDAVPCASVHVSPWCDCLRCHGQVRLAAIHCLLFSLVGAAIANVHPHSRTDALVAARAQCTAANFLGEQAHIRGMDGIPHVLGGVFKFQRAVAVWSADWCSTKQQKLWFVCRHDVPATGASRCNAHSAEWPRPGATGHQRGRCWMDGA